MIVRVDLDQFLGQLGHNIKVLQEEVELESQLQKLRPYFAMSMGISVANSFGFRRKVINKRYVIWRGDQVQVKLDMSAIR